MAKVTIETEPGKAEAEAVRAYRELIMQRLHLMLDEHREHGRGCLGRFLGNLHEKNANHMTLIVSGAIKSPTKPAHRIQLSICMATATVAINALCALVSNPETPWDDPPALFDLFFQTADKMLTDGVRGIAVEHPKADGSEPTAH